MDAKELNEQIRSEGAWVENWITKKLEWTDWEEISKTFREEYDLHLSPEGPTLEIVECGRNDEYWDVIYKFNDQFFRVRGDYDSWNGVEFYDPEFEEVVQSAKVIYVTKS